MPADLAARARELAQRVEAITNADWPKPEDVRAAIRDMSRLLVDLAEGVENG
jgi:hypothetical protein